MLSPVPCVSLLWSQHIVQWIEKLCLFSPVGPLKQCCGLPWMYSVENMCPPCVLMPERAVGIVWPVSEKLEEWKGIRKEGKKGREGWGGRKKEEGRQSNLAAQCRPSSVGDSTSSLCLFKQKVLPDQWWEDGQLCQQKVWWPCQLRSSPMDQHTELHCPENPSLHHYSWACKDAPASAPVTVGFWDTSRLPTEGRIVGVGGKSPQSVPSSTVKL